MCNSLFCVFLPDYAANFLKMFLLYALKQGCSLVALSHEDVYSTVDQPNLLLQLEYLADLVIKVEPLATGLAKDVHGQVSFLKTITCYLYVCWLSYHDYGQMVTSRIWKLNFVSLIDVK